MADDNNEGLSGELEDWFYGPIEKRPKRRSPNNKIQLKTDSGSNLKYSLFEESLGCFNVFKRQRDALKKMAEEGPNARVFSFEHPSCSNGGRRFLVTTVERFWQWYRCKEDVAFYELIPDKTPVRLFFDLEFYRASNVHTDPANVIAGFNCALTTVLKRVYDLELDIEKHMVILDSSTCTKFSEHIIVHLPGSRLFPSCVSIKALTRHLEREMFDSSQGLVYNTDATKKVTVFDNAVYSLNRNFRLYRSSKLHKNNPLKLASRCCFYKVRDVSPSPKRIFLDSLIVPAVAPSPEMVFMDAVDEVKQTAQTTNQSNILNIQMEPSLHDKYLEFMNGYGETSPFPVLEFHILEINRRWRSNVGIRTWKLSKNITTGRRIITYYLSGCRFCFNIGREHRSNGVFWIVDLDGGFCYQKCFDVDCKGTSSNYFPLPNFVKTSIPTSEEVEKADVTGSISAATECHDIILTATENLYAEQNIDQTSSKSLEKLRRRSALLEKTGIFNAFDSFYDISSDAKLVELAEEFENKECPPSE